MTANSTCGTILIRDNTLLPPGLAVESESFLSGWRVAKNLDGYGLARKIEEAKWNYFYLAGVTRTMVLGREGPETMRRAVRRALPRLDRLKFNSLEITTVVSKRFLGISGSDLVATEHSREFIPGRQRRTDSFLLLQRRALQNYRDLRSNFHGRADLARHGEIHRGGVRTCHKCGAGD